MAKAKTVKKATIYVRYDISCEMADVGIKEPWVRNKVPGYMWGMTGNDWDFHPGCHGITQMGDFRGPTALAYLIEKELRKLGYEVTTTVEDNWKYTDSGNWRRRKEDAPKSRYTDDDESDEDM